MRFRLNTYGARSDQKEIEVLDYITFKYSARLLATLGNQDPMEYEKEQFLIIAYGHVRFYLTITIILWIFWILTFKDAPGINDAMKYLIDTVILGSIENTR